MPKMKFDFSRQLNAALRRYGDGQKASEEYHDRGVKMFERVRNFLEKEVTEEWAGKPNSFSIAATFYGGSIAKGTDVQDPDFDVVMKINNREPPFTEVLNFFANALRKPSLTSLNIIKRKISVTEYAVHFTFSCGNKEIPVDLLPASASLTENQVVQLNRKHPETRRYYSSTLVVKQVKFMEIRDAVTHSIARLAKAWFKRMQIVISGGSTIFELLAVAAVLQERQENPKIRDTELMLAAFIRVIGRVGEIDKLRLEFGRTLSGGWKVLDSQARGQNIPYLLEPSDPVNNLLQGKSALDLYSLKRNGLIMRDRINDLKEGRAFCERVGNRVKIDFDALFAPA